MKKILIGLLTILTLAGCGVIQEKESPNNQKEPTVSEEKPVEQHVQIKITKDNGKEEISSSTFEFEEGQSLLDVMKDNYELDTAYNGQFITGINGEIANESEQYAWVYSINGENAMVGANDYMIQNGDVIVFDLQKWQ